jgi:hypothetical protein
MSLGIPVFVPRNPETNLPDWDAYSARGPLQAQHASYWHQIHSKVDVHTDQLFQASQWMEERYDIPLFFTILYVVLGYWLKNHFMVNRAPYEVLKKPLAVWSFGLAIFSLMGSVIVGQNLFSEWFFGKGPVWEMCTPFNEHANPWVLYFIFSKIPELLDTLFIVLRKKELIFLHWYHHIATMWFCWFSWARRLDCGGGFALMNLIVHTVMYSYYGCSALGILWPNWAKESVTILQLSQMVFGLLILGTTYVNCPYDEYLLLGGFAMYFSYFVLFAKLFLELYCRASQERPAPGTTTPAGQPKPKTKKVE